MQCHLYRHKIWREGAMLHFFRRDGAMSALLTGIVVVLVICHSPKTVINMLESYQVDNHARLLPGR